MNLKHLAHWLALAETGSFSRAAEKLHITQSALSRSIQVLEEDLGGALVDRVGKKNELTPLGLSVLERARRIVHEAQELQQGAALLQQGGLPANYSFGGTVGNYTVSTLSLAGVLGAGSTVYGASLLPGAVTFSNKMGADVVTAATPTISTSKQQYLIFLLVSLSPTTSSAVGLFLNPS